MVVVPMSSPVLGPGMEVHGRWPGEPIGRLYSGFGSAGFRHRPIAVGVLQVPDDVDVDELKRLWLEKYSTEVVA